MEKYIGRFFRELSVEAIFNSGEEAMEYIRQNDVDIVLSDIKMLDVSGLDLAKMIYTERPEIRVILISGYSNFDYARQAIQYNVSNYLTKPINFQELKMVLGEVILKLKTDEKESKIVYEEKIDSVKKVFGYSNTLLKGILNGDMQMISKGSEGIVSFFATEEYSEADKEHLYNLCEVILQSLEQNNVQLDNDYGLAYFESKLANINQKEEILAFLTAYFHKIADGNINLEDERDKMIVHRAKRFIERNHAKEISAGDVAEYVGLSPAYFSRLFHKVLHQTFIDYITNVRIMQAEKLLKESNYKIIDISSKVGFGSNTYFNSLFKKKTGMTPIEYRKYFKDGEVQI